MVPRNVCALAAAIAVASLNLTTESISAAPKPQIYVATMEIIPTLTYVVRPVGVQWYIDHRLGGDTCTAGEIVSTGGVFMFLNRSLAGGFSAGPPCSPDGNGAPIDRQYSVIVESAAACARLGAGDVPWVSAFDGTKCDFTTPQEKAHSVEPGAIFKSRVSLSRVTFYIKTPSTDSVFAQTYRIQTDEEAAVVVENANPNQRLVTYTGSATLAVNDGHGYVPYESFSLPFAMRFTRTLLTQ